MFETATWTAKNRRHFAVVERIYERAGLSLITESWDLSDQSQFAAALVHNVGTHLLGGSISAGTSRSGKFSNRREKAAWKTVTPDDGARAAVFLTLATGAMLSRDLVEDIDPVPVDYGRLLVEQTFAPPEEDQQAIATVQRSVVEERNTEWTREITDEEAYTRPWFCRGDRPR